MSDTPDFDSMSPEEMMKWMESLAKRQGADEGFTTDADLEIDEIDESDERLASVGEYKPFGMSDEDWAKMQAREAEEKAAKLANQSQATPAPEPEAVEPHAPEPVAEEPAVASADGTPDFDSMSPEEMMEWMESLAARQGATEGMTTAASMDIAEVDESDERLAGLGEYKPFGMSDEDWAKMQAREAEEKAAKLASQSASTEDDDDDIEEYEYVDDDDDYEEYYDDDEEFFEYQDDSEEIIVADLSERSFDIDEPEDSEELVLADLSALGLGDDEEDEEYEEEDSEELVMADLSALGLDDDEENDESEEVTAIDFDSLIPDNSIDDEELATANANPMDWLASLSGQEESEAPDLDLSMEALGDITGLGMDEAVGDPMDWLASLSGDNADEGVPDFSALSVDEGGDSEGSLEWMESLAASQGAPEDELVTDANLDIPIPESLREDGPGYEEFSFEDATGIVQDTDSIAPIMSMSDEEQEELVLDDPESWLDSLASGVSGTDIPDDIFDDEAFDEIPDDTDEAEEFEDLADSVKSQMDAGKLGDSPDDINKFFQSAFAKAATRDDVPDYIDMDDSVETEEEALGELPVQAEIPEWLQESMATMPSEVEEPEDVSPPAKTATAEMMVADLGLDDDIDDVELPDWLQGGAEQDTGMIDLDIFDEVEEDDTLDEVFELEALDMSDTQDTWVEAFSTEDTGELAAWYDDAVASFEGDDAPVIAQTTSVDVTLEVADLPIESKLTEGSPQNVPAWLGGVDDGDHNVEVAAAQDDSMDWLNEDLSGEAALDMPDWLKDTVDDTITESEDLPDWLAGEADIEPDEIPDWLRETMDEEEEPVVQQLFIEEETVVETPAPSEPLPVPVAQSPAPVPVSDDKIDAVAYLRSAKEKLNSKNLEGAMLDYEQVIRSNKALAQVEKELQRLVEDKAYKRNPSVNRVLGDVLMRQGKLQEALDIYRKALNML